MNMPEVSHRLHRIKLCSICFAKRTL